MNLLVNIPCLNEECVIANVIKNVPVHIEDIENIDIIVVDDGSTDGSREVARTAGAYVVSHQRNLGVGAALQTAVAYALENNYDLLVNIDADGQFDPAQISLLIRPILDGEADFVAGSRFLKNSPIPHMPRIKQWGNHRMNSLIGKLTGQKFSDVSCGFRAYSRHALCRLSLHNEFTYTQETFLSLAFNQIRIAEVPVKVTYFPDRESRIANNIWRYAYRTASIIFRTYRDYKPLRFFWSLGGAILVPAIFLIVFFVGWRLYSGRFSPHIWAGFTGASLFFFSVSFFIVGLIADMFARVRKNQEDILYLLRSKGNVVTSLKNTKCIETEK